MIFQKNKSFQELLLIVMFFSILNNGILEFFEVRLYLLVALFLFLIYMPNVNYFNNILAIHLKYIRYFYSVSRSFISFIKSSIE